MYRSVALPAAVLYELKLKLIYDRQSVGQSVLVSGTHLEPVTNFSFFSFFFTQLRACYFVAPSLTRGWVCNLLYNCFCALPEQSFLGQSPAELTAIFYCLIWDSPNLKGQVPVFISPRNRVAQLHPRAPGSLFVASFDSQGYTGGILTRLYTGRTSVSGSSLEVHWPQGVCLLLVLIAQPMIWMYAKATYILAPLGTKEAFQWNMHKKENLEAIQYTHA
jgi:hypothetical protein